jgi:hypothetical protein
MGVILIYFYVSLFFLSVLRIFNLFNFLSMFLFMGFVIMLLCLYLEGSSTFVCSADHLHVLISVRRVYVGKSTW